MTLRINHLGMVDSRNCESRSVESVEEYLDGLRIGLGTNPQSTQRPGRIRRPIAVEPGG